MKSLRPYVYVQEIQVRFISCLVDSVGLSDREFS